MTNLVSRPGRDLTRGPVGPALLAFALPTFAASVLQSLSGSINSIWVGRFLGEDALAATINGNMILFLMMALIFGTGMSATILVGKAVGGRDLDQARRVMGTSVGTFVMISVSVAALGWAAAPQILTLLGTPVESADLALAYLRVTFLGLPGALLVSLMMMGLRGAGDSVSPLWFTALSVLLDIALNPVLILGWGPAPKLGIAGSALAMAIANGLTMCAVLAWIYRRDLPIRLRGHEFRYLRPDLGLLKEIIGKGLPMGLQMIVMTLSAMTVLSLVNREGVLTTASYGVAQQLWGYLQMPAMSVAAAVSTMTAQAAGAGAWGRIREIARWGVLISATFTGGIIMLLLGLDHLLIGLFIGAASPSVAIAEHILSSTYWGFMFMAISSVLFGGLRADGVVVRPLLITLIAMVPLRLGVAFGTYAWIGSDALWLSLPAGQIATCALAVLLFVHEHRQRRRRPASTDMAIVENEPVAASLPAA